MNEKVKIVQYKWAGSWGPFKIKIPCGECSLTEGIIKDVMEKEFPQYKIEFDVLPWLDNWFRVLCKGGYHAPVIFVNGRLVGQGRALDRGLLSCYIREELAKQKKVSSGDNFLFGKDSCPFCKKAKDLLKEKNMNYTYRNVIEDPMAMHEMIAFVKPLIPSNKPVTLPQIFLNGEYIGGFEELSKKLS